MKAVLARVDDPGFQVALGFVGLALFWGTTPLSIKAGLLADWQPLWFCGLRLLTAALLLSPMLLTRHAGVPLGRAGWRVVWPIGVFGMAVNFGITVWGQQFIGAALASLIVASQPITTTIIVHLVQRNVPSRRFVLSLLIGAAGMCVVFRGAGIPGPAAVAGAAAVLVGVTMYGGVTVYIGARAGLLNPLRVVVGQNLIGGVLVTGAAVALEGGFVPPPGPQAWSSFGYLVLISSIAALLLANWLVRTMGAARFSLVAFIAPLVGVVSSVLLLDESMDRLTIVGAGLVGVALLFALGPGTRRSDSAPSLTEELTTALVPVPTGPAEPQRPPVDCTPAGR